MDNAAISVGKWLELAENYALEGNSREAYQCLDRAKELARERGVNVLDRIRNIENMMKDTVTSKKEIIKKYLLLFGEILTEQNENRQKLIGKEIAQFSRDISNQLDSGSQEGNKLKEIKDAVVSMSYWKDGSRFCHVTEDDIRAYVRALHQMMLED